MAKARKSSAKISVKRRMRSAAKNKIKARSKAKNRRPAVRKSRRKPQNKSLPDKVTNAVQVVVDTAKETSAMRRKAAARHLFTDE
jgi:hypothetical protein